ncbi:hypothetical protein ABT187_45540 [Streptomyces sp. NPDC001817]|uniref:hypothetical protein n=1 Tax=Streptomyces sp. NPDC001817 TaxID=3154398 RepID=UPI0033247B1E
MVNAEAFNKQLRHLGLQIGRLRMDRVLDEARHNPDPVHLIRLFGLSPLTAMRYVRAAHPDRYRPIPSLPEGGDEVDTNEAPWLMSWDVRHLAQQPEGLGCYADGTCHPIGGRSEEVSQA